MSEEEIIKKFEEDSLKKYPRKSLDFDIVREAYKLGAKDGFNLAIDLAAETCSEETINSKGEKMIVRFDYTDKDSITKLKLK